MYGPSTDISILDAKGKIPSANNSSFKSDEEAEDAIDRHILQQVELEILISMKIEYGLSFEDAVQSALAHADDEYLFSFPPERFPIDCDKVSCVLIHGKSFEKDVYLYIYQETEGGRVEFADASILNDDFIDFAESFVDVLQQMTDLESVPKQLDLPHSSLWISSPG